MPNRLEGEATDSGDAMVEPQVAYRASNVIAPQTPPPSGEYEWDLSWSRRKSLMRVRLPVFVDGKYVRTDEWYFNKAVGKTYVVGCDSEYGTVKIRGKVRPSGDGGVQLYLAESDLDRVYDEAPACPIFDTATAKVKGAGSGLTLYDIPESETKLPVGHWRLCYNRAELNWRLRNENTGELWLVTDYDGPCNVNWQDGGSHIFHDGAVILSPDGIAHFKEA